MINGRIKFKIIPKQDPAKQQGAKGGDFSKVPVHGNNTPGFDAEAQIAKVWKERVAAPRNPGETHLSNPEPESNPADLGEWRGTHTKGGPRSPRDEIGPKTVDVVIKKKAIFEVDGLRHVEAMGPPVFDKDYSITRADGTRATINLMRASDDSIEVDDFYLVLEESLKERSFEVDKQLAKDLGIEDAEPLPGQVELTWEQLESLFIVLGWGCTDKESLSRLNNIYRQAFLSFMGVSSVDDVASLKDAVRRQLIGKTLSMDTDVAQNLGINVEKPYSDKVRITGVQVISAVDKVMAQAVDLANRVPPEAAPIPGDTQKQKEEYLKITRRFAIQSALHSVDLTTIHTAMGHDVEKDPSMNESLKHDLVEWAPLKDLAWQLKRRSHDPWMDNWLRAEVQRQKPELLKGINTPAELYTLVENHPELKVNVSALNPHFLVAMYSWGDSREDSNVLVDPHRLSDHHNGNSEEVTNLERRGVNFLVHHAPREHMGVRHEAKGTWDPEHINYILAHDPAIKNSEILKAFVRDAQKFFMALENKGYVVPWQKLKVPDRPQFVELDTAYQALQKNNTAADIVLRKQIAEVQKLLPGATQACASVVSDVMALENVNRESTSVLFQKCSDLVNFRASSETDKKLIYATVMCAAARLVQQSSRTLEDTRIMVPMAAALEAMVSDWAPEEEAPANSGGHGGTHSFMDADLAIKYRKVLDQLEPAAVDNVANGDSSTAQTYRNWQRILSESFKSQSH